MNTTLPIKKPFWRLLAGWVVYFDTIEEYAVHVDRLLEKYGETDELRAVASHLVKCKNVMCHFDPFNDRVLHGPGNP